MKKEDFAAALSPHDLPTSNRPDPHRGGRPRRKLLRCTARFVAGGSHVVEVPIAFAGFDVKAAPQWSS